MLVEIPKEEVHLHIEQLDEVAVNQVEVKRYDNGMGSGIITLTIDGETLYIHYQ